MKDYKALYKAQKELIELMRADTDYLSVDEYKEYENLCQKIDVLEKEEAVSCPNEIENFEEIVITDEDIEAWAFKLFPSASEHMERKYLIMGAKLMRDCEIPAKDK